MNQSMLMTIAVLLMFAASIEAVSPLGNVRVSNNSVFVAGLSAGGFMAVQYHIAYSSDVMGAIVFAGGPYYCAQGSAITADDTCRLLPELVDVNKLLSITKEFEAAGDIDSLSNLSNQRVWLFSGLFDTIVYQGIMKKLAEYYGQLIPAASIATVFNYTAEHAWITNNYGNGCSHNGEPYINNCDFEAAFYSVSHLFNTNNFTINPPVTAAGQIKQISQQLYTPDHIDPSLISMGPDAYVYVPTACENTTTTCKLGVVFHGCTQTIADIGTTFIEHNGMNEVAEANNIVIVYPQVIKSLLSNPEGCFDWWGYAGSNYATKKGAQMQTIHNLIAATTSSL